MFLTYYFLQNRISNKNLKVMETNIHGKMRKNLVVLKCGSDPESHFLCYYQQANCPYRAG